MNSNYSQMIAAIFQNEIQIKRVEKELYQLRQLKGDIYKLKLLNSNDGLKIIVELTQELLHANNIKYNKSINIIIYLESKFPFSFPRIYFQNSVIESTSLSDGRDYLKSILKQQWSFCFHDNLIRSPKIQLLEIVQLFPGFVKRIFDNIQDKQFLLSLGEYHQDDEYDIEDLLELENVNIFQCKEQGIDKFVLLSSAHIVTFEPQENSVRLVNWSSIINIISLEEINGSVILKYNDSQHPNGRTQILHLKESNQLAEKIFSFKGEKKQQQIPLKEVTLQQYEKLNINQLIVELQILESQMDATISLQLVNNIMNHYQKAIEFYSAIDDPLFEDFVDRLRYFISRQDVQLILQSTEIQKNPQFEQQEFQELPQQPPPPIDTSIFDQFNK